MFDFFKKKLSNKIENNQQIVQSELPIISHEIDLELQNKCFEKVFNDMNCFKEEKKSQVCDMCTHKHNLLNSTELTKEEKKELKIHGKTKITKEFLELFDLNKIEANKTKEAYGTLYTSQSILYIMHDKLNRSKKIGIKMFTFNSISQEFCQEESCDWCKKYNKKKFSYEQAKALLENSNCQCHSTNKFYFDFEPEIQLDF